MVHDLPLGRVDNQRSVDFNCAAVMRFCFTHFVAFSVGLDKQQKKNHKYLPLTLVVSEQAPRLKEPLHKRPCVYLPVDLKDEAILLTH